MGRSTFARAVALAAALAAAVLVPTAGAWSDPGGVRTVADGLSDPRGIDSDGGKLLVAESLTGAITKIWTKGGHAKTSTFAQLPAEGPVDVAWARHGKSAYVVMSGGPPGGLYASLLKVNRKGDVEVVADIAAYQQTDPDPDDQDDFPEESNPNGLAVLKHGKVLVTDAANNDLLLIDRHGNITTVARFLREEVPWPDGLVIEGSPPPGTPTPAESVPTAVAVGPDGAWYVSELKGFPFVKGTSRIWRIKPGSENVTCDPENPYKGRCRTVATGFTSVIDITFGRHGPLYVLEIVKEGLAAAEFLGAPPIGALWAVKRHSKKELAEGELMAPGGVTVGGRNSLYVTTGTVFGEGAGAVVRVKARSHHHHHHH
jgi:DNA-binding beta-propeller fold protein YncE